MDLNNKQRAYLSSLAADLSPEVYVGKEDVTPELVQAVSECFNTKELIKVGVQKSVLTDPRDIADTLSGRTRSTVVRVIGRKIVLYKPFKTPKIILPKKK